MCNIQCISQTRQPNGIQTCGNVLYAKAVISYLKMVCL